MKASPTPRINSRRLQQLLRKMVNIYSPTGKEEDVVDFVYNYIKRHGLPVVRQLVSDGRHNLIVEPDDIEAHMLLIGHLDTTEAYDLDTSEYSQDGDEVFGLGTADMKSGCAAMVEAFLTLWENGCAHLPVALALVVGEEETGDGAQRLVREYGFSTAIVGEPTDLHPCMSHHGYLEIQLVTKGRRVHASLAQGANAATSMLHLLLEFIQYLDQHLGDAVYNLRDLTSSRSGFAAPDYCEAWIDLHLPALSDMGQLTFALEELHAAYAKAHPESDSAIHFDTIHAGYELPRKGPMLELLKRVYKRHRLAFAPGSFPSHSDANILWAAGIKPILLGPGKLEKAHTAEESVHLPQVLQAAQIYVDLAIGLEEKEEEKK
ncbi:M20 family metallopeptidase [Desulfatitalea alkaliphila]|uniref:M20/M25/M40 family metallo-hydrolase n=1 Tax=Desulfatitalea alkaliphila TaxID=2929485 RepID=A0AA41R3I3_9BACT|nr:M20/M25/M40 family metallo-hydrolase [Desulfatitalea alkaliphila]MCJ8502294.1 M20/M25/M40 family metallo-hydrolase [Desulfatitalea alkaliphila]